ncbi:hypothetical protein HK405_001996 [Cladochytrium tenue]|nr:hypothetical protein HK405_001996 [Cladochytrium tenue]
MAPRMSSGVSLAAAAAAAVTAPVSKAPPLPHPSPQPAKSALLHRATAAAAPAVADNDAGVPRTASTISSAAATAPIRKPQPLIVPPPMPLPANGAEKRTKFYWSNTDEPHATRRRLMLKKYPQIRALMRNEPLTVWIVIAEVAAQFALAYLFRDPVWLGDWRFWAVAYIVGGTVSASLLLAVHEVTHYLAFKSFAANKALAVFANLPIVLPFCVDFKRYHMDHHRFQGVEGVDGDLPTQLEAYLFDNPLGKLFFCAIQILFYACRPKLVTTPRAFQMPRSLKEWIFSWYAMNYAAQLVVVSAVVWYWGYTSVLYLAISVFFGGSLHPMAGHYLAEHYVTNLGQETYSYYGPLNLLAFNVGYHNEHHDFPNVPWTLLPELRKIAPEFYDMPECKSWTGMIFSFILTPGLGPYSRIKRMPAVVDAPARDASVDL